MPHLRFSGPALLLDFRFPLRFPVLLLLGERQVPTVDSDTVRARDSASVRLLLPLRCGKGSAACLVGDDMLDMPIYRVVRWTIGWTVGGAVRCPVRYAVGGTVRGRVAAGYHVAGGVSSSKRKRIAIRRACRAGLGMRARAVVHHLGYGLLDGRHGRENAGGRGGQHDEGEIYAIRGRGER